MPRSASAGDDDAAKRGIAILLEFNENGVFYDVQFEQVWALLQAAAKNGS